MPFHLQKSGRGWVVTDDDGRTYSDRPLSRSRALAQMKALYARVPDASKSLSVFKDARGRYRWVAMSSTAFRDRDKEIVSTKALADDVARADADGDYGPLRWWHTPNLDLGDCDFNAMSDRTLIESGTFRDERYGPLVAAKADTLGLSIGFHHPSNEPDADGVFHRIKRFERSLVPLPYPSNPYTALAVKETSTVDEMKIAGLKALGFDDATIANIQQQAVAREKAADAAGVAFKSTEVEVPAAPEAPVAEVAAEVTTPSVYDLSPDAFVELQQRANKPLYDLLSGLAGATATKEAKDQEAAAANATALKAAQDQLAATTARIGSLESELQTVKATAATLTATVTELSGDVPAGVKRASQDAATIATKEQVEALKGPGPDPLNDFVNSFVMPGAAG